MSETLKNCPLCGKEGILDFNFSDGEYKYYVICDTDGCSNQKPSMDRAIHDWNSRSREQRMENLLREIKEELGWLEPQTPYEKKLWKSINDELSGKESE